MYFTDLWTPFQKNAAKIPQFTLTIDTTLTCRYHTIDSGIKLMAVFYLKLKTRKNLYGNQSSQKCSCGDITVVTSCPSLTCCHAVHQIQGWIQGGHRGHMTPPLKFQGQESQKFLTTPTLLKDSYLNSLRTDFSLAIFF